jgi:hypothetical protein
MAASSPDDFARLLSARLGDKPNPPPPPDVVRELVLTSFYASMEREEGRELQFAVAYLDEKEFRFSHGGVHVWCPFEFTEPRPFDVRTVVKLAPANGPRRSVIAVMGPADALQIVGIIRTTTSQRRMMRHETEHATGLPWSSFALHVGAPGHLQAFVADAFVMSLSRGMVEEQQPIGCFDAGLIFLQLYKLARTNALDSWHYIRTVHRVMLRLAERGHGGTVLIQSGGSESALKGGYLRLRRRRTRRRPS